MGRSPLSFDPAQYWGIIYFHSPKAERKGWRFSFGRQQSSALNHKEWSLWFYIYYDLTTKSSPSSLLKAQADNFLVIVRDDPFAPFCIKGTENIALWSRGTGIMMSFQHHSATQKKEDLLLESGGFYNSYSTTSNTGWKPCKRRFLVFFLYLLYWRCWLSLPLQSPYVVMKRLKRPLERYWS